MKDFDIFRNTDDTTVELIAGSYPVLTEEEKERMFSMSERKFNIKERKYPQGYTNETDEEDYDEEVEGVEEYDRPMWLKFLTTAAALMLVGGGLAVGRNLMRRRPVPDNSPAPQIATAVSTGTQTTAVTDSDNVTYTIDVDAMLTGLETTAPAAVAETTAAAPAPTAPAATEPPTEAPTEPPTVSYDEAEYAKVVQTLEKNRHDFWELSSDMESKYYDYSDSFIAYYDPSGGNQPLEYKYVLFDHPEFKCMNDFWTKIRDTFTEAYGTWMYSGKYNIASVGPGTVQPYNDFAYFTEYNGRLYCWESDPQTYDPNNYDHYELPSEKPLISSVTDNSFHAVIPVHAFRNSGEEVIFMDDLYIVKENGKWLIDGNGCPYTDSLTGMTYDEYMSIVTD